MAMGVQVGNVQPIGVQVGNVQPIGVQLGNVQPIGVQVGNVVYDIGRHITLSPLRFSHI